MNKRSLNKIINVAIMFIISLIILDYLNIPSFLGVNMHNINWEFCTSFTSIINVVSVIVLYIITYKTLNERTIERENNKNEISILLIKQCYQECLKYVEFLNQETVEKHIVPKIDFNSTDNKIMNNLINSPFVNENIIMDLVKDGEITKQQIEKYFEIKGLFSKYITMRITFFDESKLYEPLRGKLLFEINRELKNLM
ncbi:hypothetical protein [Clostridium sp. VAP23]|uniref:hypothetical protein n=1 Tax=Clostridium sp. VAP23 TaxID=2949981 RepID=UPI002079BFAC|nr:hypothetical protein [Clostridium sp. VAP23]